jgi:hypothetical protein
LGVLPLHRSTLAFTYDGSAWSDPTYIDSSRSLTSVSCAAVSACVAVGEDGYAHAYDGDSWSWKAIDGFNSATGDNGLRSVSCSSESSCAAVDEVGNAFTYRGGAWSDPDGVITISPLVSVSCVSASFCVAVDKRTEALTFDGTSWGSPATVVNSGQLQAVSCAQATYCVVSTYGRVFTYEGNGWVASPFIDTAPAGENRFYAYTLTSISCLSNSFCATVDGWGKALTYQDGVWSAPIRIDGETRLTSVSCVTASFCAAVDREGNAFVYNGAVWSSPARIDPGNELTSVSCSSASFCMAVDWGGRVFTYDGSTWSGPSTVDPGHDLTSISCPSTLYCMAVDYSGNVFTYRADVSGSAGSNSSSQASARTARERRGVKGHVGRVGVHGLVAIVPLKCTGRSGARCKITVLIQAGAESRRHLTVGSRTVRLKAGGSRVVPIKLNAVGRRLLQAHHRLPAAIKVIQGSGDDAAVIQAVVTTQR